MTLFMTHHDLNEEKLEAEFLMLEDRLSGTRSKGLSAKPEVQLRKFYEEEYSCYFPSWFEGFEASKLDGLDDELDDLYDDMDDYYDVGQFDDESSSYDYPLDY